MRGRGVGRERVGRGGLGTGEIPWPARRACVAFLVKREYAIQANGDRMVANQCGSRFSTTTRGDSRMRSMLDEQVH